MWGGGSIYLAGIFVFSLVFRLESGIYGEINKKIWEKILTVDLVNP